jgi:release factor glutamine methyltransferase
MQTPVTPLPSNGQPPRETSWTILKLLAWTTSFFRSHGIQSPRADAEILLAHTLASERIALYTHHDQPLNPDELRRFKTAIKRRAAREPVAYIVGQKGFWSLELAVTPAVLIPRPETECLVEKALQFLPCDAAASPLRVLELGTGSGAIVLALAKERPTHRFYALDRSVAALTVARRNARRASLADRVCFWVADWVDALRPGAPLFDLIVSNPPYIRAGDIPGLQPEIGRFEPRQALDGGPDGLQDLRRIIRQAPAFLAPGGRLLLEIGWDQAMALGAVAADCGLYEESTVFQDYSGLDRVLELRKNRLRSAS